MKTSLMSAVAFLILILSVRIASACSCIGTPSICDAYARADAVFAGLVERVEEKKAKTPNGQEYVASQVAYVRVLESFKGMKETEAVFRTGGTSCDVSLQEGKQWLFYASYSKAFNSWAIYACDRSNDLEDAADDLLYLRGLPGSATKTRLSGTLTNRSGQPLMGVKVKVSGERQTYELYTDKNGVYEAYGFPAGKYSVKPETPPNLKLRWSMATGRVRDGDAVLLEEASCAGIDFSFTENTVVKGTVFGANGSALRDVCVSLVPKNPASRSRSGFDCTNEKGEFEIDDFDLGDYLLVANDDGRISSTEPFPPTYYPGVVDKQKATVLTITSGSKFEDFDIHIPTQQPTRTIEGVLMFSDGRPAVAETITFDAETERDGLDQSATTRSDADGRFTLTVLQGVKGVLRASMYTYIGEYESCPELVKLIKSKGVNDTLTIDTNKVRLETNRDFANVELVFPFKYCAKKKRDDQ